MSKLTNRKKDGTILDDFPSFRTTMCYMVAGPYGPRSPIFDFEAKLLLNLLRQTIVEVSQPLVKCLISCVAKTPLVYTFSRR